MPFFLRYTENALQTCHDFAVIQLFGASKVDGSHRKVEIPQGGMKMT